jgi:hypothetical protein
MKSSCAIAKELLEKNKKELKKLENAVDKDIKTFESNIGKDKSNLSNKDFEKMQKLFEERNEFKMLEKTLRTNDIINITSKRLKSNPNNIDDVIEETLVQHINKINSSDRIDNTIKRLGDMKISKRKSFEKIKENIKVNSKLKNDIEKTGYIKNDLKETDIDRFEESERLLKDKDEIDNSKKIIDYENAKDIEIFQPFGFSLDFMGRLFNVSGNSTAAKNFTLALLSNKWGFVKGKNGDIIPLNEALDKTMDRVLNRMASKWDNTIENIFKEEFKDKSFINKLSLEKDMLKLILDYKEYMYLRMDNPSLKATGKYEKFENMIKLHDEHMDELYKYENKNSKYQKFEGYTVTSIDKDKIKNFIKDTDDGFNLLVSMFKDSMIEKILKEKKITINEKQKLNIQNLAHDYINRIIKEELSNTKLKENNLEEIFYKSLENIEDKEVLKLLLEDGVSKTKASFKKSKLPLLYGFTKEINGKNVRIFDFMSDNHFDVTKGSIVERLKLKENKILSIKTNNGKFIEVNIFDDDSLSKFVEYLVKYEKIDGEKFIGELNYIINDVRRSQFIENDINEGVGKFVRTFKNFNAATMLASVILPSMVESFNVVTTIGIGNFLKSSKEYKTFLKKIRNNEVLTKEEKEFSEDILFVTSSETFQIKKSNFNFETESKINLQPKTIGDKIENVSAKYQDLIVNKINQLSNLTSYTRGVAVMGYIQKLSKLDKLNKLRAAELGWSENEASFFISKLKETNGSSSSKYNQMKNKLSEDEFNKFTYGLLNKGEALVLNPHIGEGYELLTKNPYGKLFLAFQTYITTALNKMLFKGVYIHDAEFFLTLTASSFTSSLVESLKEVSKGENPLTKYGENDMLAITSNAIRNNSYSANTTLLIDTLLSISGVNTNFSKRYDFDTSSNSAGDILNKTVPASKVKQVYSLLRELKQDNIDKEKVAEKLRKIFIGNVLLTASIGNTILNNK